MKNLLLALLLVATTGCLSHKDLAQSSADAANFCVEQDTLSKIETQAVYVANRGILATNTLVSRMECELDERRGDISVYHCDTYALDVTTRKPYMMSMRVVANDHLHILDLRKRDVDSP